MGISSAGPSSSFVAVEQYVKMICRYFFLHLLFLAPLLVLYPMNIYEMMHLL